jgi:DNA-binding MarR family transcriptional regulator
MDNPHALIDSALARLIAAGIRQHGALAKRLRTTPTDVLALHYVVTASDTAPARLARALLVTPSGATAVINRLSRAGLISRAPGPGTQRVALKPTHAGRELYGRALAPLNDDVQRLVEGLPRSDRVLLEQFLTRLADFAEREADRLIAEADADARARSAIPPPVPWG